MRPGIRTMPAMPNPDQPDRLTDAEWDAMNAQRWTDDKPGFDGPRTGHQVAHALFLTGLYSTTYAAVLALIDTKPGDTIARVGRTFSRTDARPVTAKDRPRTVWSGTPPTVCESCGARLVAAFVDGRLRMPPNGGMWGFWCPPCFDQTGSQLGTGRGQRYELRGGVWERVAG